MPNRIIKESITTSCDIDQLTAEEERFFYRLIVVCDDFGRMDARIPIIKARCFPLKVDKIKNSDIEKWLLSLETAGMVKKYWVEKKQYLFLPSWDMHQQKRAKHSKFPAPDITCNHMIEDDINGNQEISDVTENREYENTRIEKREYAANVKMTEEEYQKLIDRFGSNAIIDSKIEDLSNWKLSKGKKTKSDYHTLLAWLKKDVRPEEKKPDWKEATAANRQRNAEYIEKLKKGEI